MTDEQLQEIARRHAAASIHAYARNQTPDWKAHDWVISALREAIELRDTEALASKHALSCVQKHLNESHSDHCWGRLQYGDGECECGGTVAMTALKAKLAEAESELAAEKGWNAHLFEESMALGQSSSRWMRKILGAEWEKLWGPNLEAFGRGVDELRAARVVAEKERDELLADVEPLVAALRNTVTGLVSGHIYTSARDALAAWDAKRGGK